jgi:hypothetical protein
MHYGTAYDQSQTASEISESTRTTSQSGSRAQPNLSAEQLRQKRIVNRRAQQAFRERSKENTRRLEQELDSLRVECLSREKELLQETERLREQNEILSQRLRNIASLAMAGPDITHAHTNVHQQREDELSIVSNSASATNSLAVTSQIRLHEMDLQSERNTPAASGLQDQSGAQSDDRPYSARQSASSVAPGIPAVSSLHRRAVASDQECTHSSGTESLPASLTVNSVPESSNLIGNLAMISSHRNPLGLISAVLPVHLSPTCPLDHILLGCLQSNRAALSDGASLKLVAGPERVSVRGFIDAVPDSSAHPISRVMCEVMSTFPSVGKAEQLALFYVMHQTMKVFPLVCILCLPVTDYVSGWFFLQNRATSSCLSGCGRLLHKSLFLMLRGLTIFHGTTTNPDYLTSTDRFPGREFETGLSCILKITHITYGQPTLLKLSNYVGRMDYRTPGWRVMVTLSYTPSSKSSFADWKTGRYHPNLEKSSPISCQ